MSLVELPDIDLTSGDVEVSLNNLITAYETLKGEKLYPGDPVRIILNTVAALIVQQRELLGRTAKAILLRYAYQSILDHMGAFTDTERLPASEAKVAIRFTLSAGQQAPVTIPLGTRVSTQSNPKLYFETTAEVTVPIGTLFVDVSCSCLTAGAVGNGLIHGQINQIVDPIPFVASASNVSNSSGGADEEDDDAYRLRIREAPESFSVAGPDGAYKYWAKTASSSIVDVAVDSPADGEVVIYPLLEGGQLPDTALLNAVTAICSSKSIRPLTDKVSSAAPSVINYTIEFTYWISPENSVNAATIQTAVAQAVQDYIDWQRTKLGRNVNRTELVRRLSEAGAYRVEIVTPDQNTTVGPSQVAIITGTPEINYGGLADD